MDTFDNKEFCVVQGSKTHTKQQLEQEIVKMGGSIVQNAGEANTSHKKSFILCYTNSLPLHYYSMFMSIITTYNA